MKLEHLRESMIKLPPTMLNSALRVALSGYFSFVKFVTKPAIEDQIDTIYKQYHEKYNLFTENVKKWDDIVYELMTYDDSDVPDSYKKKGFKIKKISVEVSFFEDMQDGAIMADYDQGNRYAKLRINLHQMLPPRIVGKINRNPDVIHDYVYKIVGAVEHELTHTVQNAFLSNIDKRHWDSGYRLKDGETEDPDQYYTSLIEFSPQIRTAINEFMVLVKQHERYAQKKITQEELTALFHAYTNPTHKSNVMVFIDGVKMRVTHNNFLKTPDPFFATLHSKDKKQWRRAVKYMFMGLKEKLK